MRSPAKWVNSPAAIWERPALCTQTNRTLGLSASWVALGPARRLRSARDT
ncbi:Uncharacterised protein [Mycobacterium tuberculosis]|uniref:Uncharacterized protein n=1 Tax=Mycobacterium tuberculosis TaxID=1773 RepID=A0A916PA05_MYCTX|nr:Uncharacterised protein [Mycobacterium tuberculosis]CPB11655.1 Uncharacterised protein [Mycobacterium tuberculosis]